MAERYVHLVVAGREAPVAGRLPARATWFCSGQDDARDTARGLTDLDVRVVADVGHPTTARQATRQVLRRHPRGDLVIVADQASLLVVTAELTDTLPRTDQPDVVTVRMESTAPQEPLSLAVVLVSAVVLSLLDVGQWLFSGRPGLVVGPALLVAAIVAMARQTRDVGVSLVVAVLLAGFLDLGWLNFIPRLRS